MEKGVRAVSLRDPLWGWFDVRLEIFHKIAFLR